MTTRTRTVVTILAAIAAVTMLAATAFNGYQSLTRPPVVISNIPPESAIPAASPSTVQPSAPASVTDASSDAAAAPDRQSTHHKRAGAKRSGKVDKLTDPAEGRIDINTAGSDELQRLPGVGPAMAQRIINARQSFGGFRTAQDLLEVRGIGQKKFTKMEAFVKT